MSEDVSPVVMVVLVIAMLALAVLHTRARRLYRKRWRIGAGASNHAQPVEPAEKVRALGEQRLNS